MLFAMAMFNLFNLRLTTAGIAAFLMLIGYSIDTDILLTTRVLKRKEGTISERIASAVPTGMTMTFASLAAVLVAFYATESELMKQIMFILGWGLVADLVFTWLFNAALLRMYAEKREAQAEHGA
jgi:preprotein translocase subunit SecF